MTEEKKEELEKTLHDFLNSNDGKIHIINGAYAAKYDEKIMVEWIDTYVKEEVEKEREHAWLFIFGYVKKLFWKTHETEALKKAFRQSYMTKEEIEEDNNTSWQTHN